MITAFEHLTYGRNLTVEATHTLTATLLEPSTPESLIAGILVALHMKGESSEELLGVTRALLDAACIATAPPGAVDTCGTGGDGANTFNISTAAALVVAACGVPVMKHGNRGITGRSGSADVIEALDIPFTQPGEPLGNFAFLFAPQFHPALKRVGPIRKSLGIRTIFNLIGPLANPAQPDYQLVGVSDRHRLRDIACALQGLGRRRAFVVHGEPGLDEATPVGPFTVVDVTPDRILAREYTAKDFGLESCTLSDLRGGDAAENATIIENILDGAPGPQRDTVILNAALTLLVTSRAHDPIEATHLAAEAIDSGRGRELVNRLRKGVVHA